MMARLTQETSMTLEQEVALVQLYARDRTVASSYEAFRAMVQPMVGGGGCVLVPWAGMWMGIERDGYTHS